MSADESKAPSPGARLAEQERRAREKERLAKALRENLRKRKDQARTRAAKDGGTE